LTFGQRVKFYRQSIRKSQKAVAIEAGIPQTTLSGWETGKTEPVVSDAQKLAAALGVSLSELIEGPEQPAACLPRTG